MRASLLVGLVSSFLVVSCGRWSHPVPLITLAEREAIAIASDSAASALSKEKAFLNVAVKTLGELPEGSEASEGLRNIVSHRFQASNGALRESLEKVMALLQDAGREEAVASLERLLGPSSSQAMLRSVSVPFPTGSPQPIEILDPVFPILEVGVPLANIVNPLIDFAVVLGEVEENLRREARAMAPSLCSGSGVNRQASAHGSIKITPTNQSLAGISGILLNSASVTGGADCFSPSAEASSWSLMDTASYILRDSVNPNPIDLTISYLNIGGSAGFEGVSSDEFGFCLVRTADSGAWDFVQGGTVTVPVNSTLSFFCSAGSAIRATSSSGTMGGSLLAYSASAEARGRSTVRFEPNSLRLAVSAYADPPNRWEDSAVITIPGIDETETAVTVH